MAFLNLSVVASRRPLMAVNLSNVTQQGYCTFGQTAAFPIHLNVKVLVVLAMLP